MAQIDIQGANVLGSQLQQLLCADGIVPGSTPSYELCKTIFLYHPMGEKIVGTPIKMAQYKPRAITVPEAPDDGKALVEAFQREWKSCRADAHIYNTALQARVYGIATLGIVEEKANTKDPLAFAKLADADISFSVWDPLNTAGSLVLNQDPNAMDFQKVLGVSVNGKDYHRSRTAVLMNEAPIYIAYESAGFGFVGRSVYQRGLAPLKSFIHTMATDAMIALKAGVLVTKMEAQSSAVDAPMSWFGSQKRSMVKEAQTGNVLTIGTGEDIESLNLQNLDGAYSLARKNIIENIASACGTPAKLLLAESFAEGFGEGSEDAKSIAQYIDGIRAWMEPLYTFMEQIVMYRAWNPAFYETIQKRYPDEYGEVPYNVAFQAWRNSFTAQWPNLLEEPDSEKLKGEDVVLKAIIAVVEVLAPIVDPANKARVIEWAKDNFNANKRLFSAPLELDIEALAEYEPPTPVAAVEPPQPESARDAAPRRSPVRKEVIDSVDDEVRRKALAGLRAVGGRDS